MCATYNLSLSISKLFSAFAAADFTTFAMISALLFGVNFNIANASSTLFPLTKEQTNPAFLGDVLTYFATALAKQQKYAIKFIENKKLDDWTHNKAIQKAIESRRITEEEKAYLRSLKVKIMK